MKVTLLYLLLSASELPLAIVPLLEPVPKGLAKPTDKLCDFCSSLKLAPQDFVVHPGEDDDRYNPDAARQFGLIKDVKKKSLHCPLCRLVLRVLGPDAPEEEEGVPIEVTFNWSTNEPASNPDEPPNNIGFIRQIEISTNKLGGTFCATFPKYGTLGILANDAPTQNKSTLSRVIKDQIDFSMVRNWINICNARHENCAGVHRELDPANFTDVVDQIPCFRVIDVVDNYITTAPHDCEYVALSYVWGRINPQTILRSLKGNIAQLEEPGALLLPEHYNKMPLTIRDAMFVVKELGMRYLWVDSLCIIQDDDEPGGSKLQLIAKMAVVYGAAALTITAATGVDANAGLPGVHAGADRSQPIEEIQPGLRLAFKQYLGCDVPTSMYFTRGWTCVSLLFIDHELHFLRAILQVSRTLL